MENPYQAPQAVVRDDPVDSSNTADLLTGQKRVIYAVLLYLATVAVSVIGGQNILASLIVLVLAITFLVLGWTGIYRISRGLGHGMGSRILIMVLMLVPLLGLLTLLLTNSKATKALKAAGYTVGLLGARPKQA